MADYKVVDAEKLDADLGVIADAIRERAGKTESLSFPDGMVDAVMAIPTGGIVEYEMLTITYDDGTVVEIDFLNTQSVTTPQGEVIRIASGDELLWQKTAYKQKLLYLESTGNQWINTGYYPQFGDEIEIKNVLVSEGTGNVAVFSAGTGDYQVILLRSFGQGNISYYKYFATGNAARCETALSDFTTIRINSDGKLYFNNALVATSTPSNEEINTPLFLFIRADKSSKATGKIGELTVTRNGIIIHRFIPVLDFNDKPCMYDDVSGEFFYNQGAGEFLY